MFNTIWTKIKDWASALWTKSWTKLWAWIQGIPAAILLGASELNSFITDPTIKSYLDTVDVPKWLTLGMVTFGLITYLAHGRKD